MSHYNEKMQRIVRKYQEAGNDWPASAKHIAGWAIQKGLWKPQPSSVEEGILWAEKSTDFGANVPGNPHKIPTKKK